jgi:hypothetical protein
MLPACAVMKKVESTKLIALSDDCKQRYSRIQIALLLTLMLNLLSLLSLLLILLLLSSCQTKQVQQQALPSLRRCDDTLSIVFLACRLVQVMLAMRLV